MLGMGEPSLNPYSSAGEGGGSRAPHSLPAALAPPPSKSVTPSPHTFTTFWPREWMPGFLLFVGHPLFGQKVAFFPGLRSMRTRGWLLLDIGTSESVDITLLLPH